MKKLYVGFIVIGILGLIAVWFWGMKGAYLFNLAFGLRFLKKGKMDERERAISMKAFNIFAGIMMAILVNFYIIYQNVSMPEFIKLNWAGLAIGLSFIILGIVGNIIFNKE